MNFINALQTKDTLTENGMPTHSTSGSALVDFFYRLGASRTIAEQGIVNWFVKSFYYEMDVINPGDNALNALKVLFYGRDVREGQGERRMFRIILKWLAENQAAIVKNNLENIPFFGRFDDLFVIIESETSEWLKHKTSEYILSELYKGNKLAAKWMPRENKSRGELAKWFMNSWKLAPKQYRKLLAGNTEVVETLMCNNEWKNIKYESVPSVAMHKYRTAFFRNDCERFGEFVNKAVKGEVKINSAVLYPHQIVKSIWYYGASADQINLAQAQWNNLPNYIREGQSFIPVVDTSGSMSGEPLEVAVSLGIYLSERNKGPFKDAFITFSNRPQLQVLSGNLHERLTQLAKAGWEMNTNLEAVFKLILDKAVAANLPQEDMPKTIIILSDMQFDQATRHPNDSVMELIRYEYNTNGYETPNIVFWNLRNSSGVPVKHDEKGTALVSGFSPSIMKNVLSIKTPYEVVLDTINGERYNRVTL